MAVFDIKRKRRRIPLERTAAFVCYPVSADVIWIKRSQIRSCEDEIVALAIGVDTHCHALGRTGRVCKRIGIVMV